MLRELKQKIDLKDIYVPLISIFMAFIAGGIVLYIIDIDPIDAYMAMLEGAFLDGGSIIETLSRSAPVIFTGLAVAFALKCGLFNIGVEGQLIMGAFASAFVGYAVEGLPWFIHLPLAIAAGLAAAGAWAFIPAILKTWRGVHEVISSIMLNYVAYALTSYFIILCKSGAQMKTPNIQESAEFAFPDFIQDFLDYRLNGFVVAVLMCFAVYFILRKTTLGYEVRTVGLNPNAASTAGMSITKNVILAMLISGFLAGFAGAERTLLTHGCFLEGISPELGFDGICVALLANSNPIGIIFSGILFGALSVGGLKMSLDCDVSVDTIRIIQGFIIFFLVTGQFLTKGFVFKRKKVNN